MSTWAAVLTAVTLVQTCSTVARASPTISLFGECADLLRAEPGFEIGVVDASSKRNPPSCVIKITSPPATSKQPITASIAMSNAGAWVGLLSKRSIAAGKFLVYKIEPSLDKSETQFRVYLSGPKTGVSQVKNLKIIWPKKASALPPASPTPTSSSGIQSPSPTPSSVTTHPSASPSVSPPVTSAPAVPQRTLQTFTGFGELYCPVGTSFIRGGVTSATGYVTLAPGTTKVGYFVTSTNSRFNGFQAIGQKVVYQRQTLLSPWPLFFSTYAWNPGIYITCL
jgi:hypothetical protein